MTKWTIKELENLKKEFDALTNPDIADIATDGMSEEVADKWNNEDFKNFTTDDVAEASRAIFSACYSCADILREQEADHVAEGADDYAKESREWREELEEFAENWDE